MINKKYFSLILLILPCMTSNCQAPQVELVTPRFETQYRLGETFFIGKDTTSYLPEELVVESQNIFFVPKFSRILVEYNTDSRVSRVVPDIPTIITNYKARKKIFNDIQQWSITSENISVVFGDHLFTFNRKNNAVVNDVILQDFSCFLSLADGEFFIISSSGVLDKYNSNGLLTKQTKIKNFSPSFFARSRENVYCSNSVDAYKLNYDSLESGVVLRQRLLFNSIESQNYVLMAADSRHLFWSDLTDINKIVLTDLLTGRISRVFEIDRAILKSDEITRIPAVDAPSADPPEARQYIRIASTDKRIYFMFQSRGYVHLFSFGI